MTPGSSEISAIHRPSSSCSNSILKFTPPPRAWPSVSSYTHPQGANPESPFSFQQLTPTQSPNQPLNPIFPPFVEIKMRNPFPSNSITPDQYPGKSVRTRFNSWGEP